MALRKAQDCRHPIAASLIRAAERYEQEGVKLEADIAAGQTVTDSGWPLENILRYVRAEAIKIRRDADELEDQFAKEEAALTAMRSRSHK